MRAHQSPGLQLREPGGAEALSAALVGGEVVHDGGCDVRLAGVCAG